jgi:DNA-binding CsgD family transcriptional regulator
LVSEKYMPVNKEGLSDRELEILSHIATGASNKEIAQRLHISINTVKVHLRNIFTKIEVSSRTEAAMYAVEAGLVVPESKAENNNSQLADDREPSTRPITIWWFIGLGSLILFISVVLVFVLSLGVQNSVDAAPTPDTTRWQILEPMPTARRSMAVSAFENHIYVIGGRTDVGVTNVNERYSVDSNSWSTIAEKPTPVFEVGAVVIGGKIYIPGGRIETGDVTTNLEIYDPHQNTWERGADLPAGLSAYAIVEFEGNIYLFGGWNGQEFVNWVYKYDPVQDVWEQKSSMSIPRGYSGAAVVGESIFVLGGYDGRSSQSVNEVYQPNLEGSPTNPWSEGPALPNKRQRMGVASTANIVLVMGGTVEGEGEAVSLQLLPQSDEWLTFSTLSETSWNDLGMIPLGTNMYLIGGESEGTLTNTASAYQVIYTLAIPIIKK